MAVTPKKIFRGAASLTNTNLYTVPSATSTVVTNIVVTNTSGSTVNFTINLDGQAISSSASLSANSLATFDIKQVMNASEVISASASSTSVIFHISGVEIT